MVSVSIGRGFDPFIMYICGRQPRLFVPILPYPYCAVVAKLGPQI